MIDRREVIASGLAAALLARASAARLAAPIPETTHRTVPSFAADERFAEGRAAARAAALRGATIRSVGEDVTALYESLDLAWRASPFAVSGLTTGNALFLIERLAWDRGLRTVYRGIHRRRDDGRLEHELLGSPALIRRVEGCAGSGRPWAAALGRALVERSSAPGQRRVPSQGPEDVDGATLVSWLLLPKGRAAQRA